MQFHLPQSLNYIGVFLTFGCNLNCSYCINDPEQKGNRRSIFSGKTAFKSELTPQEWVEGLKRIPVRHDLPITFQGGEPMLYAKGRGLGKILSGIDNYADLLTNFALKPEVFGERLKGNQNKLQRPSPYPSIRVSFHVKEMNRKWGDGFAELLRRCEALKAQGFRVGPQKSDVGIYIVDHPENRIENDVLEGARKRLPVFLKDFLGTYEGKLHGTYAYPYSTNISTIHHTTLQSHCRTTEFLIDPLGFVWPCHLYMYASWARFAPQALFSKLQDFNFRALAKRYALNGAMFPIGHLLDPDFRLAEIETFRKCFYYGKCLQCDTKLKRDRFATENVYRCSVIIKNIKWPQALKPMVSNDFKL